LQAGDPDPVFRIGAAELSDRAGIPEGRVNVITGPRAIGGEMTSNPPCAAAFTGSTEIGKKLMDQCAGTGEKNIAGARGNAPFMCSTIADLDRRFREPSSKYSETVKPVSAPTVCGAAGVSTVCEESSARRKNCAWGGLAGVTDKGSDRCQGRGQNRDISRMPWQGATVGWGGSGMPGGTFSEPPS